MFLSVAHADVGDLIAKVNQFIINPIIIFVFGLAFLLFLWGVAQIIINSGSPDAKEKGSRHIMYGLIGMFIMFSVFGIMRLISNTLGADVPGL